MQKDIRNLIRSTDDRYHDAWGSVLTHGFAICEVLSAPDCDGTVPREMDYHHGAYHSPTLAELMYDPASGENYWESEYVYLLDRGHATPADLEHAARVIGRYLDMECIKAVSY